MVSPSTIVSSVGKKAVDTVIRRGLRYAAETWLHEQLSTPEAPPTPASGASARPTASQEHQIARKTRRQSLRRGFPRQPLGGYPGDFTGTVPPRYHPSIEGEVQPGEVLQAWIPNETGGGAPGSVLIIGSDNGWFLGIPLIQLPLNQYVHEDRHLRTNHSGKSHLPGQSQPRVIRISPQGVERTGHYLPFRDFTTVVESTRVFTEHTELGTPWQEPHRD